MESVNPCAVAITETPPIILGGDKKSRQLAEATLRVVTDGDFSVLGKQIRVLVATGVQGRLHHPFPSSLSSLAALK